MADYWTYPSSHPDWTDDEPDPYQFDNPDDKEQDDMAKIGDIYGGNYLKAEDLKDKGDVRVTIEKVSYDEFDGKKRALLYFRGKDKVLPLNVTNANMAAEIFGTDEMDDWIDQRICLYVTRVDFQGKRVDAIRLKAATTAPRPTPPPVADLTDEEIPF